MRNQNLKTLINYILVVKENCIILLQEPQNVYLLTYSAFVT